jgi:arylsulfatase A-like enzyme
MFMLSRIIGIRTAACLLALTLGVLANSDAGPKAERGQAEHVVLIVWDGMRPDFVTETHAPVLWALARKGVTFRNHHSVYPSLTNVNSTVLATGVFPARSGLLANYEYRPELERAKFIRTDHPNVVQKADELSDGRYLTAQTVAELVHAAGGRTAIVAGKTASLLHDRQPLKPAKPTHGSVTIFSGETVPPTALAPIVKLLGPFPDLNRVPGAEGDKWTTRALTELLWADGVPQYSVLWLSEPDRSEHVSAPGSEEALAAIKSSDANLANVLRVLDQKGVRDQTDILVVSDHGFSTIERAIDLRALMRDAGFTVIKDGDSPSKPGEVRVVGNGGTILFYITEHAVDVASRLVEWLQNSDFAGVIFSRTQIAGTFPQTLVHIDTPSAPDLAMTFRWTDKPNKHDAPGMIYALTTPELVAGTHGTLSKFDLHNILIAVGPDFRSDSVDELPTSNVDVVPTILDILKIKPPDHLDGRILSEAMVESDGIVHRAESSVVEATCQLPSGVWHQYLRISKIGDEVYVDEGNGEFRPK